MCFTTNLFVVRGVAGVLEGQGRGASGDAWGRVRDIYVRGGLSLPI